MNLSDLANSLNNLTSSWKPSGATTSQDLRDARLYLADGFFSGVAPQAAQPASAFRTRLINDGQSETDAIAQLAKSNATILPYVRSAADVDPASIANVAGMKVSKTLGPFVDSFGIAHWVDLIPLPRRISITSATRGILGYLLIDTPAGALGAGSLWIAVDAFNVPLATTGAVGLSFSSGTIKQVGNVSISPTAVAIGVGGKLTLKLSLVAPTPPTPPLPGLGQDSAEMTLALPAQVTIEFAEAGVIVSGVENSTTTVYGTTFKLKRNAGKPLVVAVGLNYLLFPCDCSITQFTFQTVLSTDVVPSGQAAVTGAGWALPITLVSPPLLGAAASAGCVALQLGTGLALLFNDPGDPISLTSLTMALAPGSITISAVNGARDVARRLTLWAAAAPAVGLEPAPSQYQSEIKATVPRGAVFFGAVTAQREAIAAFGQAQANVDRPLASDGTRLPIAFADALIAFVHTTTKAVVVVMSSPNPSPSGSSRPTVIALENALLQVGPPATGLLYAVYSGTRLDGTLEFTFENVRIVLTLADPYASANSILPVSASVSALATWVSTQSGAVLRFGTVGSSPIPEGFGPTTLLDLSGNADQFGVTFRGFTAGKALTSEITFDGVALAVPQEHVSVYALPGISWEPVVDQRTGDWLDAPSPDDGPPTLLTVKTVNLVRLEPNAALPAFGRAGADGDTFGQFTLPFGLMANLAMTSANTDPNQRPSYSFVKGTYASGLSAVQQLSIRAQSVIAVGDPALPGNATTGSTVPVPFPSSAATVYGVLTLGNDDKLGAAQYFDQQFSAAATSPPPQIPISRIDISGYGTSMFSDWKDPNFDVGVRRLRFDVLLGRTAFELVQLATVIFPWCIRITRAVVFDRYDTGLVVRHDTGWKAIGIGEFELLASDQKLLGPVEHLQNIHNIVVGTGNTISADGKEFVPVTFDADIVMSPSVTAISHGNTSPVVAGTQIQGYGQLTVGSVARKAAILDLMALLPDGVSGPVGCILNIGSAPGQAAPKFTLNVSSIMAKATKTKVAGQNYSALAIALHGTPRLPRDGAWSITRRGQNDAQPSAVDPMFPIPLIFGSNNDRKYQWRILDPEDALSTSTPNTVFGLMQGTGTSKSLFENPVIDTAGRSLLLAPGNGVPQPRLADVGSLLGASGVFPNLGSVLQIPTQPGDAISLAQDGFQKTSDWPLTQPSKPFLPDQKLLDLGAISLVLQYHGPDSHNNDVSTRATHTIDANAPAGSPRWSLTLTPLNLAVLVKDFGPDPVLTIHGTFEASEIKKAGFNNITIDYGSALAIVKNIISGLTALVTSLGGTVDLDVGFSDSKLTVHDALTMPVIPLGFGEIKDVAIDLGVAIEIPDHADFHVGLGSKEKPFSWIVDPLCGTGAIVLGALDGDHNVYIEAGIGAALAIDLAIASGSASINLELSIAIQGAQFALAVALVGNASVDVLDGLASVSLTLAASIMIVPHPAQFPPDSVDLTAAVAVGIHISVAWVASVDFDGSWAFTQNVSLHLL